MANMDYVRKQWLMNPKMNAKEIHILEKMKTKKIVKHFGNRLNFGADGVRGMMGVGTARINRFTIAAAAYAYGTFLLKNHPEWAKKGIVIGHDNRHNSNSFSMLSAQVLTNLKIKVFLFKNNDLQPTPFISYAVRKLKLGGAIIIAAGHNPKEHNGFKVYNNIGGQLLSKSTNLINVIMSKLDLLNIPFADKAKVQYINEKLSDQYIQDIMRLQMRPNDSKVLKVVFTPQHGASHLLIPRVLQNMNIDYVEVKSQMENDSNFSKTKTSDPGNPRSFNRGIWKARFTNSDIVLCANPDGVRLGIAVKHKKRFKFLNGNETAALYLNYLIQEYKNQKKDLKGMYIVKSIVSGDLVDRIAHKHNITVHKTHVGFRNIADFIEKHNPKKCLFAFEESFGFLINPDISRDKDSAQSALGIVEAANYYKTQNSNLFKKLRELNQTYSSFRSHNYSLALAQTDLNKILERIINIRELGNLKVAQVEDYREGLNGLEAENLIKIIFKNRQGWVVIRSSENNSLVKCYLNLWSESSIDNAVLEKQIKESLLNFIEDASDKITFRHLIKYFVFVGILLAILITLLFSVYDVNGDPLFIFREVFNVMRNSNKGWLFLLIGTSIFLTPTLNGIYTVRALRLLNHKVKFRHAFIAAFLSTCISAITPFATGGAIASYWYMRKKGYPRSEVMANYFMSSLLYQASLALRASVFLPLGFYFFSDVFFGDSFQSKMVLSLTLIGTLFDIFAAFMISLLTFSKRMHHWIVRNSIYLLEWLNLTKDPESIRGKYLYEMRGLRLSMNQLWHHKIYLCEFMFYELVPVFVSTTFFAGETVLTFMGNNQTLSATDFLKFITGQGLIRSANNMIPTPGGSGTTEWMTEALFNKSFPGIDYGGVTFTALNRFWTYIVPILISAVLLFFVYINERVNRKINSKIKNYGLNNRGALAIKNRFRVWVIVILLTILFAFFGGLALVIF